MQYEKNLKLEEKESKKRKRQKPLKSNTSRQSPGDEQECLHDESIAHTLVPYLREEYHHKSLQHMLFNVKERNYFYIQKFKCLLPSILS